VLKFCRSLLSSRDPRDISALPGLGWAGLTLSLLLMLGGCQRFHPQTHDHVYVAARQVFLHDRVAAVSNRVAQVINGEALEVIERGRRFVKVRTPKGEIGWLEDHAVIDDKLYGQFQDLTRQHAQDPVVANGQLRDDLYLHVLPGRETAHFLLIAGNAKVQLLERGTVEKTAGGSPSTKPRVAATLAVAKPAVGKPGAPDAKAALPHTVPAPAEAPEAAPASMEDWWLVRDGQGNTGWLLASRLDVDVPDEIGVYAEGQRMVAAYPIAKVLDSGAGREHKGEGKKLHGKAIEESSHVSAEPAQPVNTEFTEYVTVLSPPKGGLPYDFDQIRVFTWSLNHHRYETAFRLHGIQGYLPVRIGKETVNGQPVPNFNFQIASGPNVSVDPQTGVTRPANPRTLSFRLEGNLVRRSGSDLGPIILTHEPGAAAAAKAKAAGKKKR
jgi:hypothetical protein